MNNKLNLTFIIFDSLDVRSSLKITGGWLPISQINFSPDIHHTAFLAGQKRKHYFNLNITLNIYKVQQENYSIVHEKIACSRGKTDHSNCLLMKTLSFDSCTIAANTKQAISTFAW